MNRPAPRKSTLAGKTPVTDRQDAPTEQAPAVEQPAPAPAEEPAAPEAARKRKKVSFEQHPDDTARMRGAVRHTMVQEPHRSMTDFINRAIMAEVERLEKKYNGGEPFEPVQTGVLAPGRRMGE